MGAAKSRRAKFKPLTQREITKAFERHWDPGADNGAATPKKKKEGAVAGRLVRRAKKSKPSASAS